MATAERDSPGGVASELTSRRDGPAKQAIVEFVAPSPARTVPHRCRSTSASRCSTTTGTLWCEKPMPIQFDDFIMRRLAEMAAADPAFARKASRTRDPEASPPQQ